ncbi:MAG: hypothetical protein KAJ19_22280 [Gammaproteobacteria bacterium]|nr:hypothetical protein [Gammaproteobacteria bacterium]
MTTELKELHHLRGLKARHTPYELTDGSWQKNPEHEEEVTLLEYFNTLEAFDIEGNIRVHTEGILFARTDFTLGRDRLDSFIIIK